MESARELLFVLEQTTDILTMHFASVQMQQVFTESVNSFPVADRRQLRALLLPILENRVDWFCKSPAGGVPGMFALSAFAQLLARIWRICWFEIADNIEIEAGESDSDDDVWLGSPSMSRSPAAAGMNTSNVTVSTGIFGAVAQSGDDSAADDPLLHVVAKRMILESQTIPSTLVGITVLVASIEEMAKPLPHLWPAVQRKTAVAFRDRCLLDIFKIGLQTMQKLLVSPIPMTEPAKTQQRNLVSGTLDLMQRVFGFDFVGTCPDESSDDLGIIHIPAAWSSVFELPETFSTFGRFYTESRASEQTKALEIISSVVSVRSSVFGPSSGQAAFLSSFFDFLGKTITDRRGLDEPINAHILCRLLVKLKCNFNLSQFVAVPAWKALIELIANFHIELMSSPDCNPNLVFYMMSWWQRLCASVVYLSANSEPTHLQEILPGIVHTLIKTTLKREEDYPGEEEQSLISDKQLTLVLATLPPILDISGRSEIENLIIDLFNQYGAHFASFNAYNPNSSAFDLAIVERQLAFLVHLVTILSIERGSSLSSSSSSNLLKSGLIDGIGDGMEELSATDQLENLEVEMVSCVFKLLQLHDERFSLHGPAGGSYSLEYSLACFLKQFSANYFGTEDVEKRKLHRVLEERHGLTTKENVLEAILSKVALNLKNWSNGTDVAKETLQLFLALVNGGNSSRLVAKSELVAQLLAHHTDLDLGPSERNRREFYRVLGRIAFKDSEIEELYTFLAPFETKFSAMRDSLQVAKPEQLGEIGQSLMILLCDMRGALMACHSSSGYENFFDWFYPSGYFDSVCLVAIQRYAGFDWRVVWSVLRFVEELVTNTHKRIQFPNASPDGHRLFRDTANLLIVLAEKIMEIPIPNIPYRGAAQSGMGAAAASLANDPSNVDPEVKAEIDTRYKAIMLFLRIFSRLLSGASDFANIGVFALFGDKIVSELFVASCGVLFSMDIEEAQSYPKLIDVLYIALENICVHNITDLLGADLNTASDALGQVLLLLKRGLRSKVVRIVCCCTQSLDKIAMHQYNAMHKRRRPDAPPNVFTEYHANVMGDIMFELIDLVLVDHDMIHWTLCRPLFVLIQLLPDMFGRIQNAIIKSQSQIPGRAEKLEEAFKALSQGLDSSMRAENREKFTNNALELKNTSKTLIDFNLLYKEMLNPGSSISDGMS